MKNIKLYWKLLLIFLLTAVILNSVSFIHGFCDWYVLNIYRKISEILTGITAPVPFSVGEIIMYTAMAVVLAAAVLSLLLIFLRKREGFRKFTVNYLKAVLMALVITVNIYTLNWMIPFRTTPLDFGVSDDRHYTIDEILTLRNYLADQVNEGCRTVERDENGFPTVREDYTPYLKKGAENISAEFPAASGTYPKAKQLICSPFLEWMYIGGFTFPYTMEIASNRYSDELFRPALEAHELAHHLGYYRENEGNFFEYLICINSEDALLQYSGAINAYFYVDDAFWTSLYASGDSENFDMNRLHEIDEQYFKDSGYFMGMADELYNQEVSDTAEDVFMDASGSVADVGWKTQSDLLQEAIYDGVVELLLKYYDGKIY